MAVSDLAVNSSLLLALLDLSLVKMITQAMRAVDHNAVGGSAAPSRAVSGSSQITRTIQSTIAARAGYCERPAASFQPSRVPYWHPRLSNLQPYTATRPVQPADCQSSIQPPWKVLPWPTGPRPIHLAYIRSIKIQPGHTDVSDVGRTLDLFV